MPMNSTDDLAVRRTEAAMEALESLLPEALERDPHGTRATFNNALLNVAVNRIVAMEGPTATAALLWRLTDALASDRQPQPGAPLDLSSFEG